MKHLNSSIEIGSVFSKWTVIDRAANGTDNQKRWKVVCICGNKGIVANYELQSERSKGCRSCRSARKGTHYQTKSPEYRVFNGMWSRCTNPKDLYY